jgi:DNA-binding NarL/FixJ family response regulator
MGTADTVGVAGSSPRADASGSDHVWRLMVVDDDPAFLATARRLMGGHPRLNVVAEGASGAEALSAARAATPDVALLDVQMPSMDGFETAERLRAEHVGLRVVLTSVDDLRHYRRLAAGLGAGFLPKRDWSADALLGLIEAAD